VAYTVAVDPRAGRVTLTVRGEFTLPEACAAFDDFVNHPDFVPGMDLLCDLREAVMRPRPGELEALVRHIHSRSERRGRGYRVAFVVASSFEQAVIHAFHASGLVLPEAVHTFTSMDEAAAWLAEPHEQPA